MLCPKKHREKVKSNGYFYRHQLSGGNDVVLPLNVLEKSLNKRISLMLKDGRSLEGKLVGYDDFMNLVLEETEETKEEQMKKLGTVVLRGNNVVTIVPK